MNLKQINKNSIIKKLLINQGAIIHIVPDFDSSLIDYIDELEKIINLNNNFATIIKTGFFKIRSKTLNSRKYFIESQKKLKHTHFSKILKTVPTKIPENRFIIIDHSIISKAVGYMSSIITPKQNIFYLFQQLKKEFQDAKTKHPSYENVILFLLKNTQENNLFNLLHQVQVINKDDISLSLNVFDKFALVNINQTILPILGYSSKGNVEIYRNSFSKIKQELEDLKKVELLKLDDEKIENPKKIEKITSEIFRKPEEINQKQLSSILRKYKIKDPVLINNINNSIDNYLQSNQQKAKREELEQLILKSIHFSIFGHDKIREEYLDDPNKLFSKLIDLNTYSQSIEINEPKSHQLLNPQDLISLKKVTGPIRHEYEFNENIHETIYTLFGNLGKKLDAPVKILSIKHEYNDNNLNRYIEYNIKVKNLTGKFKKPYNLKIKLPALVNQKYFKLNGNNYIMSSQQFLNPITKDRANEVRFISHYNMIRTRVINLKFNVSEISRILEYIEQLYPQLIKKKEQTKYIFQDDVIIDITSNEPFIDPINNQKIQFEDGKFYLVSNNKIEINKNDYIFSYLLKIIKEENNHDNLVKGKKAIPYLEVHIMGRKMPLIIYFWQQLGLIETLIKFNVDYDIATKTDNPNHLSFKLKESKLHLFVYPKNKKQEFLVNGLFTITKNLLNISENKLSDRQELDDFLNSKYGTKTTEMLDLATENMIDPTTKELLDFQDLPTNIIDIISGVVIDKIFNDSVDHPSDLNNVRVRQAEVMSHILYEELFMAYNKYRNDLNRGMSEAQIKLHDDNYVIRDMMGQLKKESTGGSGGSLINYIEPFSPIDEIVKASRVVKTGKGGIPSKISVLKEQRNIHKSFIGNISAHSTSEYSDVGIVNTHALGVSLSNKYGNYGGKKENPIEDNWDSLSIDEALVPFVNQMESIRLILARTHMGQKIPIINPELAIVETGAEYIVPQLTSTKFVFKAKDNGKVIDKVENESLTIKYKNGKQEILNILPRHSSTKRNSNINITLETLNKGESFKKNDLIAWAKMFKNGVLAQGRNNIIALLNYNGMSFEDGYVISEKMSNDFITETVKKINIIVPNNTKILNFVSKLNTETKLRDVLLEFEYTGTLDNYLLNFDANDIELENQDIYFEEKNNTIKTLSPGGELVDLRIKLNNQKDVDPMLLSIWKKNNQKIKKTVKSLTKLATTKKDKLVDNLDLSVTKIGNHKIPGKGDVFEGALIEFFIKQPKQLNKGDKISNRYGAKGVVSKIISETNTPKSEFSGNIDIFLSPTGLLGRKNISIIKELYIGKIIYHLPKIISKQLKNKKISLSQAKNTIFNVYDALEPTKNKRQIKSIKTKFENLRNLEKLLIDEKIRFNYIIPPFNHVSFENINNAAKILNIPLDEKVFLPEFNIWTKQKVPVGINYFSSMEQFSDDYDSTRSTASYVPITGQPTKGKAKEGGQSIGPADIYNLLTYEAQPIINEMMLARSDNARVKREIINNLFRHGKTNLVKTNSQGKTFKLFKTLMHGMGLEI